MDFSMTWLFLSLSYDVATLLRHGETFEHDLEGSFVSKSLGKYC